MIDSLQKNAKLAVPDSSLISEPSILLQKPTKRHEIFPTQHEEGTTKEMTMISAEASVISRTTAESSMENLPETKVTEPTAPVDLHSISLTPIKEEVCHTIVCREWQTECRQSQDGVGEVVFSTIPEKDAVLWQIKDFAAFRAASKVSRIPPLISPEFGGGCRVRLKLHDKKGHITGCIEIPIVKASRDGLAHFKISVVKPDLKQIITRKVEMKIHAGPEKKGLDRHSNLFRLTKKRAIRSPRIEHLIIDDCLRIRVEFQYFPFDAPVFRGLGLINGAQIANRGGNHHSKGNIEIVNERKGELLNDIRNYCKDDQSQNVEIRRDDVIFHSCRFLLCARSRRFREIFGNSTGTGSIPLSARGSPSRFFQRNMSSGTSSLSSVTIRDISAEALDELLSFIHTDSSQWVDDYSTDILKVLELFEAADLYGVEALSKRLVDHLTARMDMDNFVYLFEVAERCGNSEFKRICTQFMDSIPGSQVASLIRASTLNSLVETPRVILSN